MINLKDINYSIKKKRILNNINFNIEENSITQIFGPNGAGKTSLFKIISGIISQFSGNVLIRGKNIKDYSIKSIAKQITFLPQFHYFSLPISVKSILIAGRYPYSGLFQSYSNKDKKIMSDAVENFNISELLQRDAQTLSGGEIKKVMLASAFIQNVPIILLDEPFVSLDPQSAIKLKEMIVKLNKKGKTIIVISHRMELMYPIATHIIAINEGRLNYAGLKKFNPTLFKETLGIDFKIHSKNNKEFVIIDG